MFSGRHNTLTSTRDFIHKSKRSERNIPYYMRARRTLWVFSNIWISTLLCISSKYCRNREEESRKGNQLHYQLFSRWQRKVRIHSDGEKMNDVHTPDTEYDTACGDPYVTTYGTCSVLCTVQVRYCTYHQYRYRAVLYRTVRHGTGTDGTYSSTA